MRRTVVLKWDRLSFSYCFWIPLPSTSAYAGPNGSAKWLWLPQQPAPLLKNTAVPSSISISPTRAGSSWARSVILITFNEGCGNWPKF